MEKTAAGADERTHERLKHARLITEHQMEEALDRQKKTGRGLLDILMQDLSLKTAKDLLTYEIHLSKHPEPKQLKEVMVESGWVTEKELEEALSTESKTGLAIGEALVEKNVITRMQLGKALIEQERTGHSLWRTLINLGFANAKQISDALRLELPSVAVKHRKEYIVEGILSEKLIPREKLEEMVAESEKSGKDFGELLVSNGLISSKELARILESEIGVPYVDLSTYEIDGEVVDLLPESFVRSRRVLPLRREAGKLVVAMLDPKSVSTIDDLRMISGRQIDAMLAIGSRQLDAAIDRVYGKKEMPPAKEKHGKKPVVEIGKEEVRLDELVESVSVVNLVASVIEGAIHSEATDVHLEPQEPEMRVRYRIDGLLYDVMTIPRNIEAGLISRLKILSNMDITQKRLPQDGHFSMEIGGETYDMRIATLPTSLGEKLVVRLLNPKNVFMGLKQLGLDAEDYAKVDSLIHEPYGLFLTTGPIGCGKTTTLYAALNQINILTDSIVTIEDPIEYELPGINQVQVDYKINRTFANTLRAVLRQDVDTLLVGEVRDVETAQIASGAAVTGHLVFSTLHTNDAVGAISRLAHLQVPHFLISTSIIGIVAQRLVRKICAHCREEYEPGDAVLEETGLKGKIKPGTRLSRGKGCSYCYHTGYRGRTGIFEVLMVNERIRELILRHASEAEIRQAVISEGMRTLFENAAEKVKDGVTTPEELMWTVRGG